jgi:hypothetical protein
MNCEVCDLEEFAFTVTPAGEGAPRFLGPACFARFGLELAREILPAEEIAATLGPMFVTPAREDLHEGAEKVRKGRKSKAAPEAVEPEEPAEGAAEIPAAAADE